MDFISLPKLNLWYTDFSKINAVNINIIIDKAENSAKGSLQHNKRVKS